MNNKQLYLNLKNELSLKGTSVKWWVDNHLPKINYNAAMAQFHGNYEMSDYVKKAIKGYLNGETTQTGS